MPSNPPSSSSRSTLPRYAFRGIRPRNLPELGWVSSKEVPGLGMIPPTFYSLRPSEMAARQKTLIDKCSEDLLDVFFSGLSSEPLYRDHTCWSRDLLWTLNWAIATSLNGCTRPIQALDALKHSHIAIIRLDRRLASSRLVFDVENVFQAELGKLAQGDYRAVKRHTQLLASEFGKGETYGSFCQHALEQHELIVLGVAPENELMIVSCQDILNHLLPALGCSRDDFLSRCLGRNLIIPREPKYTSLPILLVQCIREATSGGPKMASHGITAAISLEQCSSSSFGLKRLAGMQPTTSNAQLIINDEKAGLRKFCADFARIFEAWLLKIQKGETTPLLTSSLAVSNQTERPV